MHGVEFTGPRGPFRIDPMTNNVIQNIYVARIEEQGDSVGAVIKHTFSSSHDGEEVGMKRYVVALEKEERTNSRGSRARARINRRKWSTR